MSRSFPDTASSAVIAQKFIAVSRRDRTSGFHHCHQFVIAERERQRVASTAKRAENNKNRNWFLLFTTLRETALLKHGHDDLILDRLPSCLW